MTVSANRHMLFGLLALQNGIINQGQLVAAFQAWTLDKSKSLAEYLEARGDLRGPTRAHLEGLADFHLEAQGGDVEKSLAAVAAGKAARVSLALIGDPEIGITLGRGDIPDGSTQDGDPDATTSYAVGLTTSDGQRFRILRPHAQGGLGAVFVAIDSELNREVALKQILDRHADDPVSRHRFLLEAEITGGLEHPGIVPVYGLGTYEGGRPYYAMRFIRGDSLKDAIASFHADPALKTDTGARSLALRTLLRRFTDVCNAVDYAHTRGVLHRDIKPGNIIVGKHGETLVVDWGLAKAVDCNDSERSADERPLTPSSASGSAETLPGSALGTPGYMSPEQAAGDIDRLGGRSDVYSLGATLYCLLTGRAPFEGDDVGAVLRSVQKGDFRPPRHVDPRVDRALEAVCLKAMALQPHDRYSTPRALADDVERWGADEPVSARREPLTERMRRWLKRRRTSVTAAAAAVLVALVGLAAIVAVQTTANRELKRSNQALDDANVRETARFNLAMEAIGLFHGEVSEDVLLKEDRFKSLRTKLLRGAAGFYERLEGLLAGQEDGRSLAALGAAYNGLGRVTSMIGAKLEALAVLKKGLAVRRNLAAAKGAGRSATIDVARSLLEVGTVTEETGDIAGAIADYEQASVMAEGLAKSVGGSDDERAFLSECFLKTGRLRNGTGKTSEATASFERARSLLQQLADANPGVARYRRDLARALIAIGFQFSQNGNPTGAMAAYEQSLALRRKLAEADPTSTDFQLDLAQSLHYTGILLSETGKPREAMAAHEQSLVIQQKLVDANPTVTRFQRDLAVSYNTMGLLHADNARTAEARASYQRALAVYESLSKANPAATDLRYHVAETENVIGLLLSGVGKTADAMAAFERAQADMESLVKANASVIMYQSELAYSLRNAGWEQFKNGETDKALAREHRALKIREELARRNPTVTNLQSDLAGSYDEIAEILQRVRGNSAEALTYLEKSRSIRETLAKANPSFTGFQRDLAHNSNAIARQLLASGEMGKAMDLYNQILSNVETLARSNPDDVSIQAEFAVTLNNIGDRHSRAGESGLALASHRRALAVLEPLAAAAPDVAPLQIERARSDNAIGRQLMVSGQSAQALASFDRARATYDSQTKADPSARDARRGLAASYAGFGRCRALAGKPVDAAEAFSRAVYVLEKAPGLASEDLAELAAFHSLLASVAGHAESRLTAAPGQAEAETALATLRRAASLGYRDVARLRSDTDFDSLRVRPDFQLILMDLAMPEDPLVHGR